MYDPVLEEIITEGQQINDFTLWKKLNSLTKQVNKYNQKIWDLNIEINEYEMSLSCIVDQKEELTWQRKETEARITVLMDSFSLEFKLENSPIHPLQGSLFNPNNIFNFYYFSLAILSITRESGSINHSFLQALP